MKNVLEFGVKHDFQIWDFVSYSSGDVRIIWTVSQLKRNSIVLWKWAFINEWVFEEYSSEYGSWSRRIWEKYTDVSGMEINVQEQKIILVKDQSPDVEWHIKNIKKQYERSLESTK